MMFFKGRHRKEIDRLMDDIGNLKAKVITSEIDIIALKSRMDAQIKALLEWQKATEDRFDVAMKTNFKKMDDFQDDLFGKYEKHYEFAREHNRAMEKWAEAIHAIVEGKK